MVFFMKDKLNCKLKKFLLGFASGVMIAASIWSLIIPSLELSIESKIKWLSTTVGFSFGIILLLVLDKLIERNNVNNNISSKKDLLMMIIAVTLHNIPEGIAVGVAFAGALSNESFITIPQAMVLSLGVAIQNFPEGAIISLPLKNEGVGKKKSFIYGVLSGIVEPIGAIITIKLTSIILPFLPLFLAFAAGAMFYVVINELIPETNIENGTIGTISFTAGFLIMMILDISLG